MTKYSTLLQVLDRIRAEASGTRYGTRYPDTTDTENINQQRSLALIHLYLKVSFGLLGFEEREHHITDGANDGGVDAYFIDRDRRRIIFIQSKFRASEQNFTTKRITLEELLAMDVMRILEGHKQDEAGHAYNGKISQLQREISSIEDIARYKYEVVLLANVTVSSVSKLSRVVGGLPCDVIDHERCYNELVFPVISGTYFNAADLTVHLDLSNKHSGSKITYTVDTRFGSCDITALFVPTVEIAKAFSKYKNSMLRFNPRSYLELEGAKVNEAIRSTILHQGKNEFALYNNGITMLSDETHLNERIGQRNKAQLNIKNPQIINGGQTAYTLSRVYEEQCENAAGETIFDGKEVLLKLITLNSENPASEEDKVRLIDAISAATNLQTTVITADRYSNEPVNVELQQAVFERYGLLFERKRGEFADGLRQGYISRQQVVERNQFLRILFAANGDLGRAVEKRLFARLSKSGWSQPTTDQLDRFYFGYLCLQLLNPEPVTVDHKNRERYAKLYVLTTWFMPNRLEDFERAAEAAVKSIEKEWAHFVELQEARNIKFVKIRIDRETQRPVTFFSRQKWIRSGSFGKDVKEYFETRLTPKTD